MPSPDDVVCQTLGEQASSRTVWNGVIPPFENILLRRRSTEQICLWGEWIGQAAELCKMVSYPPIRTSSECSSTLHKVVNLAFFTDMEPQFKSHPPKDTEPRSHAWIDHYPRLPMQLRKGRGSTVRKLYSKSKTRTPSEGAQTDLPQDDTVQQSQGTCGLEPQKRTSVKHNRVVSMRLIKLLQQTASHIELSGPLK